MPTSLNSNETTAAAPQQDTTWSARRAKHRSDDKRLMARHLVRHDFLVGEGMNPDTDPREPVASILVNQGTTPNVVVEEVLQWIVDNPDAGPFDITWYTPGALVPATLRTFRQNNLQLNLSSVTQLFLFPGRIDPQTESVSGVESAEFVEKLERHFTYAFLSANSFDLNTGTVYFHLKDEVRLQRACATRIAAHKFLFFDATKFKREGETGYRIDELLKASKAVTLYTVSSAKDEWIRSKFEALCSALLDKRRSSPVSSADNVEELDKKALRLQIVGKDDRSTASFIVKGFLKPDPLIQEALQQQNLL